MPAVVVYVMEGQFPTNQFQGMDIWDTNEDKVWGAFHWLQGCHAEGSMVGLN